MVNPMTPHQPSVLAAEWMAASHPEHPSKTAWQKPLGNLYEYIYSGPNFKQTTCLNVVHRSENQFLFFLSFKYRDTSKFKIATNFSDSYLRYHKF